MLEKKAAASSLCCCFLTNDEIKGSMATMVAGVKILSVEKLSSIILHKEANQQ